jgi:hypothetical protein
MRVGGAGTIGGRAVGGEKRKRIRGGDHHHHRQRPVGGCAPPRHAPVAHDRFRGKTQQPYGTRRVTLLFRSGLRASPHVEELVYSGACYLAAHRPRRTIQTKPYRPGSEHPMCRPCRSALLPSYPPGVLINPVVRINPETNMLAIKATTTSAVYCIGRDRVSFFFLDSRDRVSELAGHTRRVDYTPSLITKRHAPKPGSGGSCNDACSRSPVPGSPAADDDEANM